MENNKEEKFFKQEKSNREEDAGKIFLEKFKESNEKTKELNDFIENLKNKYQKENIGLDFSISVMDILPQEKFGYQDKKRFYPASLSKIFIAAELMRKVKEENIDIKKTKLKAEGVNVRAADPEFEYDLKKINDGDNKTIEELLEYMLTVSNNTSANILTDYVDRKNITKNIMEKYNWSPITRKFVGSEQDIDKEVGSEGIETSASEYSELLSLLSAGKLIGQEEDNKILEYLSQSKTSFVNNFKAPEGAKTYQKDGWFWYDIDNGKKELILNSSALLIKMDTKKVSDIDYSKYAITIESSITLNRDTDNNEDYKQRTRDSLIHDIFKEISEEIIYLILK